MKNILLFLIFATANAAQADVTSSELVSRILIATEAIKGLDSDCAIDVTASTTSEEFAAITVRNEQQSLTLKLRSSVGNISMSKTGDSGHQTETFTTRTSQLSLTSYEDLSDLRLDLRVGNDTISCKFSE